MTTRAELVIGIKNEGLDNLGKVIDELDKAGAETSEFKAEAAQLRDTLTTLNRQQQLIDSFVRLKNGVSDAAEKMAAAQEKAQRLGRELAATEAPTKDQEKEMRRASAAVNAAKDAYQAAQLRLQGMRQSLSDANINTNELAKAQTGVRNGMKDAEAAVVSMTTRLKDLGDAAPRSMTAVLEAVQKNADAAGKALDKSFSVLGVRSVKALESELDRLKSAMDAVRNSPDAFEADKARAVAAYRDRLEELREEAGRYGVTIGGMSDRFAELEAIAPKALTEAGKATQEVTKQTEGYKGALTDVAKAVGGLFAAGQVIDYARSVNDVADQYKNLEARVRLAVGSEVDLQAAVGAIGDVAKDTNSNLDATAELFGRLAASGKELNITNDEALSITKTINQAIQVSGASSQASEASVRQLVQALQSGALRGDEFNSIMEQSPRLAKALADGLGVPVGALRGLAEEGELTSARVVQALKGQAEAIDREFSSLPLTTGRALENLNTQWTLFIGNLTGGAQQSSVVAEGINALANNLETIAGIAARAGTVLTAALAVQGVQALRSFALEMATTGKAADLMSLSLSNVPKVISITVAAVGFEVGWQIGEMLYENSELARKLGVGITAFMQNVVNDLMFLKEAAAAVFTDDTVEAAFERYRERGREMDQIFSDMWKDAAQTPQRVAAAAESGAAALQRLGGAGTASGAAIAAGATAGSAGLGKVKQDADTAAGAMERLANVAGVKLALGTTNVDLLAYALANAAAEGGAAARKIGTELPEAISKLSGEELARFESSFRAAMVNAKADSGLLEKALLDISNQAAASLGVDIDAASSQMSRSFLDAKAKLDVLVNNFDRLKERGTDAALVVANGLQKLIDSAKNSADIDALVKRTEALRKVLGSPVVDGLLERAKAKAAELKDGLDDLRPGIDNVAEAMRVLGITSDAALKKTAEEAMQAYDVVRTAGTSSAREVGEAFKKAAEAAIAANGGLAPSWVQAQAAVNGYTVVVDNAGKATLQLAESLDRVKDSHRGAAAATNEHRTAQEALNDAKERELAALEKAIELKEREDELERKRLGIDRDGFSVNSKGDRVVAEAETRESLYEKARNAGLTAQQADRISKQFIDERGQAAGYASYAQQAGESWSVIVQREIQKLARANDLGGAGGLSGGSTSSTSTQTTSVQRTINLNFNGKSYGKVNTDSAGDSNLNQFLSALQEAAGRSS